MNEESVLPALIKAGLDLDRVRTQGDFEGWMAFYLDAISFKAHEAY